MGLGWSPLYRPDPNLERLNPMDINSAKDATIRTTRGKVVLNNGWWDCYSGSWSALPLVTMGYYRGGDDSFRGSCRSFRSALRMVGERIIKERV